MREEERGVVEVQTAARGRKRFYDVSAGAEEVLAQLLPQLSMVAPVERVVDAKHGEGVSLQLGTKEEGATGHIRIFPDKRLALLTSESYGLALKGLVWVEPARYGVRLSGRLGNQVARRVLGLAGGQASGRAPRQGRPSRAAGP